MLTLNVATVLMTTGRTHHRIYCQTVKISGAVGKTYLSVFGEAYGLIIAPVIQDLPSLCRAMGIASILC